MPSSEPPPDLARSSLAELARFAGREPAPPVESWDPPDCGTSGIAIGRDGGWSHHGRPIRRPEMVRLFARLLRREPDGSFVLVTPVEKLDVDVEDTPFVAVEVKSGGAGRDRRLAFRLNSGGITLAGPDHPLRIEPGEAGPRPLLAIRPGLDARLDRPVYYELAELALEEASDPLGLWSDGAFFRLDEAR